LLIDSHFLGKNSNIELNQLKESADYMILNEGITKNFIGLINNKRINFFIEFEKS